MAFTFGAASCCGQGSVAFTTFHVGPEVNAPFYDNQGLPLTGPAYVAQLYAGQTADSLSPIGAAVPFGPNSVVGAGYVFGDEVIVPTPTPGGPSWVQVRAWAAAGGATYEQAAAAGAYTGLSNILFLSYTGNPQINPGVAVPLVGLQFLGVPEPAPWLLGLLGFGILAFRPRRRG